MRVKGLMEALKKVDPELPVVTFANGHSYHSEDDRDSHGPLKIGIAHCGYEDEKNTIDGVIIGNVEEARYNYPNEWVGEIVTEDEGD